MEENKKEYLITGDTTVFGEGADALQIAQLLCVKLKLEGKSLGEASKNLTEEFATEVVSVYTNIFMHHVVKMDELLEDADAKMSTLVITAATAAFYRFIILIFNNIRLTTEGRESLVNESILGNPGVLDVAGIVRDMTCLIYNMCVSNSIAEKDDNVVNIPFIFNIHHVKDALSDMSALKKEAIATATKIKEEAAEQVSTEQITKEEGKKYMDDALQMVIKEMKKKENALYEKYVKNYHETLTTKKPNDNDEESTEGTQDDQQVEKQGD